MKPRVSGSDYDAKKHSGWVMVRIEETTLEELNDVMMKINELIGELAKKKEE